MKGFRFNHARPLRSVLFKIKKNLNFSNSKVFYFQGLFSQRNHCNLVLSRSYSTSNESNKSGRKWDLYSGVCLERKPLIMKALTEKEQKVLKALRDKEVEDSYKSNHEVKGEEDKKRAGELKTNLKLLDLSVVLQQTAHEFEEISNKEFDAFQPQSVRTLDDERKNVKSLNRQLRNHLLFLVKVKLGDKKHWILPQGIRKDSETMRESAERVLREICGDKLNVLFLGNAPCGFFKWTYPKGVKSESVGAKLFFFKAIYLSGQVTLSDTVEDYQWAVRSDLKKLFSTDNYFRKVSNFLIEEEEDNCTVAEEKEYVLKKAEQKAG